MDKKSFIQVPEVARLLDCSERTVRRWAHREKLPHYKLGKNLRFIKREVVTWREERHSES